MYVFISRLFCLNSVREFIFRFDRCVCFPIISFLLSQVYCQFCLNLDNFSFVSLNLGFQSLLTYSVFERIDCFAKKTCMQRRQRLWIDLRYSLVMIYSSTTSDDKNNVPAKRNTNIIISTFWDCNWVKIITIVVLLYVNIIVNFHSANAMVAKGHRRNKSNI